MEHRGLRVVWRVEATGVAFTPDKAALVAGQTAARTMGNGGRHRRPARLASPMSVRVGTDADHASANASELSARAPVLRLRPLFVRGATLTVLQIPE
jgi:hypothetical protein